MTFGSTLEGHFFRSQKSEMSFSSRELRLTSLRLLMGKGGTPSLTLENVDLHPTPLYRRAWDPGPGV